jgi:hypothetical protein
MPYPSEHAARILSPISGAQYARKQIAPGISIILMNGKTQAYRFKKRNFTPEQARNWLKSHKIKYMSFEQANS